jgi:hypothetical protein
LTLALSITSSAPATATDAPGLPIRLVSSRVSLSGTSNIHAYTASTTDVRLVRAQLADGVGGPGLWTAILEPGALLAFEIAIPAATLSSPREGIDRNMHKALKVTEHPDITFRLSRLEAAAPAGTMRGIGTLTVAGVEREVTLALKTTPTGEGLSVRGEVPLVMTDFGVAPPKAMLGMLRTDPKIRVTFEAVLAIPLT